MSSFVRSRSRIFASARCSGFTRSTIASLWALPDGSRDAIDFVISDVSQDVFQVGARVEAIQLACRNRGVHRGGPQAEEFNVFYVICRATNGRHSGLHE